MPPPPAHDDLLKISELAHRTGVPVGTIRFYIREGLLPRPTLKTSRNMAYYDESFVARIRFVRRLQEERRLPLAMIRSIVSGGGEGHDAVPSLVELEAKAAAAVEAEQQGDAVAEAALLARTGLVADELVELCTLGVVTPDGPAHARAYGPLDVAVAETVGRVRALGLSRELFPTSDLVMYRDALRTLVAAEVSLFAQRTQGRELPLPEDKLIEGAVHTLGELIRHLRKKLILELLSGGEAPPEARPARPRRRGRA
jgi:DNA-binding transcriptional MerR regulator